MQLLQLIEMQNFSTIQEKSSMQSKTFLTVLPIPINKSLNHSTEKNKYFFILSYPTCTALNTVIIYH